MPRFFITLVVEINHRQQFVDNFSTFFGSDAANLQAKANIFGDGHFGKESVILKDDADVAVTSAQVFNLAVTQNHGSSVRVFQPRNDAQRRAFTAA